MRKWMTIDGEGSVVWPVAFYISLMPTYSNPIENDGEKMMRERKRRLAENDHGSHYLFNLMW